VGSVESGIEATETRSIEAQDECRRTEENSGGATEKMGSAEGEEDGLTSNDKAALTTETGRWSPIRDLIVNDKGISQQLSALSHPPQYNLQESWGHTSPPVSDCAHTPAHFVSHGVGFLASKHQTSAFSIY
jgi:hypothetical protein